MPLNQHISIMDESDKVKQELAMAKKLIPTLLVLAKFPLSDNYGRQLQNVARNLGVDAQALKDLLDPLIIEAAKIVVSKKLKKEGKSNKK